MNASRVLLRITSEAEVSACKRILKRYPNAEPEDYIFYPQYLNRTTASTMLQRTFTEILRQGGIETDTATRKNHTLYSLRHTAVNASNLFL